KTWWASVFFRELMPTRPLLEHLGSHGTGKTVAVKKPYAMIFGTWGDFDGLPAEEREYGRTVSSTDVVVFDNADTQHKQIEDLLARTATGGYYSEGKHYENGAMVRYRLRAFVAFTSRTTAALGRADLASR